MAKMKAAGYDQDYRKHCLQHALNVYDKKLRDNDDGVSPLKRAPGVRKNERRKEKQQKRKSWSQKVVILLPSSFLPLLVEFFPKSFVRLLIVRLLLV